MRHMSGVFLELVPTDLSPILGAQSVLSRGLNRCSVAARSMLRCRRRPPLGATLLGPVRYIRTCSGIRTRSSVGCLVSRVVNRRGEWGDGARRRWDGKWEASLRIDKL